MKYHNSKLELSIRHICFVTPLLRGKVETLNENVCTDVCSSEEVAATGSSASGP